MATAKCTQCKQTVYPLERTVLAEQVFHKGCAKCSHCSGTLSISSFASVNGKLFCKPHYIELFKSSGGKYSMAGNSSTAPPSVEQSSVAAESHVKPSSKLSAFLGGSAETSTATATVKPTAEVAKKENDSLWKKPLDMFKQKSSASEASVAVKQEEKKPVVVAKVESTKEEQIEKPVLVAKPKASSTEVPAKGASVGMSKLSMFLSGENVSASANIPATVPEVVKPVSEVIAKEPTPIVPSATSTQQPTGLSKLSMFLQQVENPAATECSIVKPASNVVKGDAEVITEKQESISELIKKTSAKPSSTVSSTTTFSKQNAAIEAKEDEKMPKVLEQKLTLPVPAGENETQVAPSTGLSNLKEKLSQAKKSAQTSTVGNNDEMVERLREELALYKSRCNDLEEENTTLRARVELSDAGKEVLVLEIARLNAELEASKEQQKKAISSIFEGESNENTVDNGLKHAKKLLLQGKITKSQYEAAAKACAEASRVIHNA